MSQRSVRKVCGYISIGLIVVSVLLLFAGWAGVSDRDSAKEVRASVKELKAELSTAGGEVSTAQSYLDAMGIDVSVKSLYRQLRRVVNIVEDAKLSPGELVTTAPVMIRLADAAEQYSGLSYLIGSEFGEAMDAVNTYKTWMILAILLFVITLVAAVISIVLHIRNSKLPGISPFLCILIWTIAFGVVIAKANDYADDSVLGYTAAPWFALLFSLAAAIVWIMRQKIAVKFGMDTGEEDISAGSSAIGGQISAVGGAAVSGMRRGVASLNEKKNDFIESNRLKNEIAKKEQEITAVKTQIGDAVYTGRDHFDMEMIREQIDTITGKYDEIESLKVQLKELAEKEKEKENRYAPSGEVSTETMFCPQCGKQTPVGSRFCAKCGAEIG